MIWIIKLIWGLTMAFGIGYQFIQAWEKEHGSELKETFTGKPAPRDTYIWTAPTTFLWIILVIIALLLVKYGFTGGAGIAVSILLNLAVFFSIYFVVLLSLMPYLRTKISSRACATLWFCPIFMFYSFSLFFGDDSFIGLYTIYLPRKLLNLLLIIWLAGFAISYTWSIVTHFLFRRRALAEAYAVADETTLAIWNKVCEELDFMRPTALLISPAIASPFSMGRIRRTRCTVLPQKAYSGDELRMIFLHEVHHLQRWDVDTKVFLTVLRCACWFNPMVWIAANKAAQDLELSCDEIVTEQMSSEERRDYARLLLSSASRQNGFTTCLSASAGALRYRLKNVVQTRSRKLGKAAIMLTMFISTLCYNVISFTDSRGSLISFIIPENTEYTCRYVSYNEDDPNDYDAIDIDRLLTETKVEHFLTSANLKVTDDPICYIYINEPSVRNGSQIVTFYEDYITVSDRARTGAFLHSQTYKILRE